MVAVLGALQKTAQLAAKSMVMMDASTFWRNEGIVKGQGDKRR